MESLSSAQTALRFAAREFAQEHLRQCDPLVETGSTPQERFAASRPIYQAMVSAGFLRRCIPAPLGGDGSGLVDAAILAEELYGENGGISLTLFGTVLGLMPVILGPNDELRDRVLAPFLKTSGTPLSAFCMTEPGGSANISDSVPVEGLRTIALQKQGGWQVSGAKKWVSSATGWDGKGAELLCIVCRGIDDAGQELGTGILATERPQSGIVELSVARLIDSVGHRAHLLPEFQIKDLWIPNQNAVTPMGEGGAVMAGAFTATAALVGVFGVALMRTAWEYTLNFAKTETRGGSKPIIEHQAVGYALADAKSTIEAARALSWRACIALDNNLPGAEELAIHAKVFGSERAVEVLGDLMKIVGVESYDRDCPLAGLMQDALALPVFDGGNMGVRRKQLHQIYQLKDYDQHSTLA